MICGIIEDIRSSSPDQTFSSLAVTTRILHPLPAAAALAARIQTWALPTGGSTSSTPQGSPQRSQDQRCECHASFLQMPSTVFLCYGVLRVSYVSHVQQTLFINFANLFLSGHVFRVGKESAVLQVSLIIPSTAFPVMLY